MHPISLAESLRPWQAAGISHLLFEEGWEDLRALFAADGKKTRGIVPPAPGRESVAVSGPDRGGTARQNAKGAQAPTELPAKNPTCLAPAQDETEAEEWPAAWAALLSRTPRAPIVWTYAELGADLSGRGDKARSICLRNLIGSLDQPKGSNAFWPLSLPEKEPEAPLPGTGGLSDPVGRPDRNEEQGKTPGPYFRQGLRRLQPRAVIFIGRDSVAQSGLELALDSPFAQLVRHGVLYVLLPDISSLSASAATLAKTGAYLRSALAGLPALYSR